jgi:conjugal transfer pilus assembly protein TraK
MMRTFTLLVALLIPVLAQAAENGAVQKLKNGNEQIAAQPADGEFPTVVLPQVTTSIRLSSSDMNRISCAADIREALTSTEKGLTIKITGKDAFVKFKVTKKGEKFVYSTTPTELYVVCGDETFSMVIFPQRIPSQTISLTSGRERKIKENLSLYAGLPFEKKLLKAIKDIYTGNIPDSYSVVRQGKQFDMYREIYLTLKRTVDIEGEGLRIKEYEISLRGDTREFKLNEKMFLKTELAENPVAISLEHHILRVGDTSRLYFMEQKSEKFATRKLTGDLPVMESAKSGGTSKPAIIEKDQTVESTQETDDEK